MKKLDFLLIITFLFAFWSCGPSIEGETKSWDKNVEQLKKMQTNFPAYADLIKTQLDKAQEVFNSAANISDEEDKADKMREANNMLNQGCVGNLKNMSSKIDDVNNKNRELKNMMQGKSSSDIQFAEMILEDSKDAVKKAKKVLNKNADKMDSNPCTNIESAFKGLTLAYDDITNAISKFNKADADAKDEQNKKEEELKAEKEKKEEAAKLVECEHCGKMNEPRTTECKSCGAPIK